LPCNDGTLHHVLLFWPACSSRGISITGPHGSTALEKFSSASRVSTCKLDEIDVMESQRVTRWFRMEASRSNQHLKDQNAVGDMRTLPSKLNQMRELKKAD
jgi:hypothetical protein